MFSLKCKSKQKADPEVGGLEGLEKHRRREGERGREERRGDGKADLLHSACRVEGHGVLPI